LKINRDIYNNDDKKIAFVLSLLDSGEPAMWKEQFIKSIMDEDDIDFPMYEEFLTAFKNAFKDVDQVNEALNNLGQLRQGKTGKQRSRGTHHNIPTLGRKSRNILSNKSQPSSPHQSLSEIS